MLADGLIVYVGYCLLRAKNERGHVGDQFVEAAPEQAKVNRPWFLDVVFIVAGLISLAAGSRFLVQGAVQVARDFGVGEFLIGLTIVAIGTSLPEMLTSVIASLRGNKDIAVANVVGSNLFNLLCVLGATGCLSMEAVPVSKSAVRFDMPVMVAAAGLCLPIFITGRQVSRKEGVLLFGAYMVYTISLIVSIRG